MATIDEEEKEDKEQTTLLYPWPTRLTAMACVRGAHGTVEQTKGSGTTTKAHVLAELDEGRTVTNRWWPTHDCSGMLSSAGS